MFLRRGVGKLTTVMSSRTRKSGNSRGCYSSPLPVRDSWKWFWEPQLWGSKARQCCSWQWTTFLVGHMAIKKSYTAACKVGLRGGKKKSDTILALFNLDSFKGVIHAAWLDFWFEAQKKPVSHCGSQSRKTFFPPRSPSQRLQAQKEKRKKTVWNLKRGRGKKDSTMTETEAKEARHPRKPPGRVHAAASTLVVRAC